MKNKREKELEVACKKLSYAIGQIDEIVMPEKQRIEDIKNVGCGVTPYDIDCDELAVVERVSKEVGRLRKFVKNIVDHNGRYVSLKEALNILNNTKDD